MTTSRRIAGELLGLVGAAIGATLGYYTFRWIYHQGFYGLMIPGAMLGLGCGALARRRSFPRGLACGLAALALGTFVEWRFFPFIDDPGFRFFVSNVSQLNAITIGMIVVGSVLAFVFGKDCATDYFGATVATGTRASSPRPAPPAPHSEGNT